MIIKTSSGIFYLQPSDYQYLLNNTSIIREGLVSFGIEIGGGYRVLMNSTEPLSQQLLSVAVQVIQNRLDSYGVKSIQLYSTKEGYIIVDLPYGNKDLIDIISQQGTFYAKVGDTTVFNGSEVKPLMGGQYSGLLGCSPSAGKYICRYYFTLILSQEAAERFAKATENLSVIFIGGGSYLNESITFYLDNKNVSSLLISASLKGKPEQQVMIEVSGIGDTLSQAQQMAYKEAKNLYIILQNGQLPSKFNIVEITQISPAIGYSVLKYILIAVIIAMFALVAVIYYSYRNIKAALLILLVIVSEFIITSSIGVLIKQTFDLAAILGIILGVFTGLDDQIVALDEIVKNKGHDELEKKISKVMFIILTAILLEFLAIFPLFIAGLGLYKGFAVMAIITIMIGYFITRPAFIEIARNIL